MGQMTLAQLAQQLGFASGPMPAHPSSRGALLGMEPGYQAMPDMKASIEDQRNYDPTLDLMRHTTGYMETPQMPYHTSFGGPPSATAQLAYPDPTTYVGPLTAPGAYHDPGAYSPSYPPDWKPPYSPQAPYRPSATGPNLPRAPYPAPGHLPIAPGDPGWTPPPSPSGPHNRRGDPDRPGYQGNWEEPLG